MPDIVELIDKVLTNVEDEQVIAQVHDLVRQKMSGRPLNRW